MQYDIKSTENIGYNLDPSTKFHTLCQHKSEYLYKKENKININYKLRRHVSLLVV